MENKRLAFVVDEDKVEALRICAKGLGCVEDDMIYDEYKAAIEDRDSYRNRLKEAGEKFAELEQKIDLNAIQELEVCKADNENLLNTLNKTNECLNLTTSQAIESIDKLLDYIRSTSESYQKENVRDAIYTCDLKDIIKNFGLDEKWLTFIEEEKKYKVVEVDVTMKKCQRIQVVVPSDYDESDVDDYLESYCSDGLESLCDNADVEEWEMSKYIDSNDVETKEEIDRHYDKDMLFPGSEEINEELF